VSGQKVLESTRNLDIHGSNNVLKGLFGSTERLVSSKAYHFSESFKRINGLLDLGERATCGIILSNFEEAKA
jgi:hypothetical protein